ncbi:hypothetical protein [Dactylosporangium sp. CA-092794]|uniref:hypothetical protein n=1 Tax=Dactylosporangium sp. CA-092794 TaxID=3239929 RepID=UPI003D930D19
MLTATACLLFGVVLLLGYLRMARAVTVNSDGASNALQAWDLFHGNPLLRGWTLSDVSFYPTELVQYGLVQLVTGVSPEQIHVAAAITWTLVVLLAAWLARPSGAAPSGAAAGSAPATSTVAVPLAGAAGTTAAPDPHAGAPDAGPHASTIAAGPDAGTAAADPAHASAAVGDPAGTRTAASDPARASSAAGDPAVADRDSGEEASRGRTLGAAWGWLAAVIAVAILFVPMPGLAYQTLLSSPNHTGSAVPLLIAWLLVERARHRAWMPYAVAVVLAWGAAGDPLITFVGAAPLVAMTLLRALRRRELRGVDARLALAGVASIVLSHAALWLIERLGGFHAPRPPIQLSPVSEWPARAGTVARMVGVLFGTYRPGVQAPWVEVMLQAVHIPGVLLAILALSLTAIGLLRGTADRLDAVLAVAIVCDLGAEIVSTLPIDLLATREIAPVLPMSAVLAARLADRWLLQRSPHAARPASHPTPQAEPPTIAAIPLADGAGGQERHVATDRRDVSARRRRRGAGADRRGAAVHRVPARAGLGLLAVVLAVQVVALVGYAPPRADPIEGQAAADWLQRQGLRYGLGSYWVSNNITVGTSRAVTVVPVLSGNGKLTGMCWQTHIDMYDPSAHDARFVLLETERPMYGTPRDVLAQYGQPLRRVDIDRYAIFVYDRNLLDGFSAAC